MLTRADIDAAMTSGYALVVIGAVIVALLLCIYFLPAWIADRRRWSEPVEPKPTYPPEAVRAALDHLRAQRGQRP